MTAILALDPATVTGWVIAESDPPEPCNAAIGTLPLPGDRANRGLFLARWLGRVIQEHGIGIVAYEAPAHWHDSQMGRRLAMGLAMVIEMQIARLGVAGLEVEPGAWHKSMGIKGKKREEIKKEAFSIVTASGWPVRTQDEADAIGILLHAASRVGK